MKPYTYDDESECPICDGQFRCDAHGDIHDAERPPLDRVHEIAGWLVQVAFSPNFEATLDILTPYLRDLRDAVDEYDKRPFGRD